MDPFLILTMVTCGLLALWACDMLPNSEPIKPNKSLPGVSDEDSHKEFMKVKGNAFKSFLNSKGYPGGLGVTDFLKPKSNKQ